jgi:hypothetical protein
MSNTARKYSSETRIRLLSEADTNRHERDELPPLLKQQSRGLLHDPEPDNDSLDLKEPFFYACLLATVVFVFFSMY